MVTVRPATPADVEAVWRWRNDPVSRAGSVHTAEVPWADHVAWFDRVLAAPNRYLLVGLAGPGLAGRAADAPIGVVRFDAENGGYEVSINLAPEARGRRLAVPLLRAGAAWLRAQNGAAEVIALVRDDNAASMRTFLAAGYAPQSHHPPWTTLTLSTG